jgi:hypothetical protein
VNDADVAFDFEGPRAVRGKKKEIDTKRGH